MVATRSDTQTAPVTPVLRWIVAVAFFMQMLDGTILNTALPAIGGDLGVDPLRMHSVIIAYMLTTALIIPASGWIAERFGTRRVFVLAVILFSAGSLLCAAAQSLNALVGSRVVQGVGGALMVPVGRLVIMRAYPRRELVEVLSFVTIPALIGPLVGPTAGGFMVQYASWHWIFLINIPAGVLGVILAWRYMPNFNAVRQWKFDGIGFALFGLAMVLITFSMEGLGEMHLPKVQVTVLCAAGILLLATYWIRALRIEHPLFPPLLFKTHSFTVGILGNLFSRLGSGGMPFLMPLFFQLGLGFSPLMAGVTMIPSALAGMIGKSLIPHLLRRMGYRLFLTLNTIIIGAFMAGFSLMTVETPYAVLFLFVGLFGIFNSMQFTAMNTVTLIDLDNEDAGSGNSLLSVTMQVSMTCGVAMAAALLDGFSGAFGGHAGDQGVTRSVFCYTFLCVGVFCALSAGIFSQVPKETGTKYDDDSNCITVRPKSPPADGETHG